mgnify:CR=1 FL=1
MYGLRNEMLIPRLRRDKTSNYEMREMRETREERAHAVEASKDWKKRREKIQSLENVSLFLFWSSCPICRSTLKGSGNLARGETP